MNRRDFLKLSLTATVVAGLPGCGTIGQQRPEDIKALDESIILLVLAQTIRRDTDGSISPVRAALVMEILAKKDQAFGDALKVALQQQEIQLSELEKVDQNTQDAVLGRLLAQKALAARSTDDLRRVLAPLTGTTAQRRQFIDAMNLTPDEALGRIQGGCPSGRFILTTGENGEGTMRCAPVPAAAPK